MEMLAGTILVLILVSALQYMENRQLVLRSPEAQKKSSRQNATLKSHKPLSHYSHPGMNNQGLHGQVDGADGLSDDRGMADMPSERAA